MLRACPICLPTYLPIFYIPSEFLPASSPIQLFASEHAPSACQPACILFASHLKSCLPSLLFSYLPQSMSNLPAHLPAYLIAYLSTSSLHPV